MAVSGSFKSFVIEQLGRAMPGIRARNMFGGVGIYAGDAFFALIDDDTLYFKVDDTTRPAYTELGMGPFRPHGEGGVEMQYYQVSEELLEDPATLGPWVADAVAVARRAKRRPGSKPVVKSKLVPKSKPKAKAKVKPKAKAKPKPTAKAKPKRRRP